MKKRQLLTIPMAEIHVGERLRPGDDEATIAALAKDIEARGLRNPIEVAPRPDGGFDLVTGLHRHTAVQVLGWDEIEAFLVDAEPQSRLLDELLENMTRRELCPIDKAVFANALRDVLTDGKRGAGGDRRSTEFQSANLAVWSETASQRTGWSPRTLERYAGIGGKLAPETIAAVRGTPFAEKAGELESLSKHSPVLQADLVALMTRPEKPASSVVAARREIENAPQPDEKPQTDKSLEKLLDQWARASRSTRVALLEAIEDDLTGLGWGRT